MSPQSRTLLHAILKQEAKILYMNLKALTIFSNYKQQCYYLNKQNEFSFLDTKNLKANVSI
jgi:ribosome biogenesis protein Nip4